MARCPMAHVVGLSWKTLDFKMLGYPRWVALGTHLVIFRVSWAPRREILLTHFHSALWKMWIFRGHGGKDQDLQIRKRAQ